MSGSAPKRHGLAPYSLKDAPAFIEAQFPVGRVSAEAYKERKAGNGQTLTALGSYWKGRKPLILCRAVMLGALLPATNDPVTDLEVFLAVMAMDDQAIARRFDGSAAELARLAPEFAESLTELNPSGRGRRWRPDLDGDVLTKALTSLPYSIDGRLKAVRRPEEVDSGALPAGLWSKVNAHLGTSANSVESLVDELGVARFGRRPRLADTFSGSGSIPFEAARIGFEVSASDLNPVACMLTWGAFNIIGATPARREEISAAQAAVAERVDAKITQMGIEHDLEGNRAKAYLYCLETVCPRTGWTVPMAPSWVISKPRNVVAKLLPDHSRKRYNIVIETGVTAEEMEEAARGTVQNGRLVHLMNPDKSGVELKVIRGDRHGGGNALRPWSVDDFVPRRGDIWQERLYCIQWITKESLDKTRPENFFASVTEDDLGREARVEAYVAAHLEQWQADGLVPDMAIDPGDKTDEPIRTRGWTYWHHLFAPRQLLLFALLKAEGTGLPTAYTQLAKGLDRSSKLCRWHPGSRGRAGVAPTGEKIEQVFDNQALNVHQNYGVRSAYELLRYLDRYEGGIFPISRDVKIDVRSASEIDEEIDVFVTDPPYADAVKYEELLEFFTAWLRKNPPAPFDKWTWDNSRSLAIRGRDANFRRSMVDAYAAMTRHMPENGIQIVMFTHQDAGMWADLAGILWAAGLRVTAAWNIVTETETPFKVGNYVQGTVCLVLRKRSGQANTRRMEIEVEIEDEVKAQLASLTTLDSGWTTATGGETLYTDGDLTLAAYAAALRVVTAYATIDRRDVGADVFRDVPRREITPLRALIDYAASVANRELVPRDFARGAWRDLNPASRFYVRMLDMEARGKPKVADFQNFAKSFALSDYAGLMGSMAANEPELAGAATLKASAIRDPSLAQQPLFQVLFAIWKTIESGDPKPGLSHLRAELDGDYWAKRLRLAELTDYVALKTVNTRPAESAAAALLAEALKVDRL